MAAIDERLIDPAPDALVTALHRATKAANGRLTHRRVEKDRDFWARFVARAANKPEGSQVYTGSRTGSWDSALVRVAWWTDPVGRRHWRVVGRRMGPPDNRLRDFAFAAHPLWHVYPDRLALREQGGATALLARCDCGVVGPAERIAWMGECCGPCHDRGEEGLAAPPAAPVLLRGHGNTVAQLAFAGPDVLVSGGADGRVLRWDLEDGSHEVLLHRRGGYVNAVAASPGLVAVNTAYSRVLLRRTDAEWRQVNLRSGQIGALAISPDERWLAVAGANSYLVDLGSPELTARLVLADCCVGPITFSPDSRTLWALDSGAELHRIDVASGRTGRSRARPESDPDHFGDFFLGLDYYPFPRAMACSPDGRWVAVIVSWGGWFGTHVGDLATGRWFALRSPSPSVCSHGVAFTAGGGLASADNDGAVRLWDVARQQVRGTLLANPHAPSYQVPAFSADAERVALGGTDGTIRLVAWRALLGG
jgi:WD40 repeat protein